MNLTAKIAFSLTVKEVKGYSTLSCVVKYAIGIRTNHNYPKRMHFIHEPD